MTNAIQKFPVPLIFKKILKDRMSGELTVTHEDFNKELFFINGHLAFATTSLEHERLGGILLSGGKIDRSQLDMALQLKQSTALKIGEILAEVADLKRRDIYDALMVQVKKIAISTFPLKTGEWRFVVKNPRIPNNQALKIRVSEIIYEGSQTIIDISYFKERFLYRSPVATTIPPPAVKALRSDDFEFYRQLATFSNVSVARVLRKLDYPEPIFWRNMVLFYLLNAVDFTDFTVDDVEQNKSIEEIYDLHQKMKAGHLNPRQLLATRREAAADEIEERYHDYSSKYNPDKINAAPDSTAVLKAKDVFAEIQKAYEMLKKEVENRDPGAGAGESPVAEPPSAAELSGADQIKLARENFAKANSLYKQKKYFEAATLLEKAIEIDDSRANYFLLLGLCQSKMTATKKMAERNLKRASDMEPWNADPVFALGQLYRSENLMKKAKAYFEKALEINLEHTMAGKAMKDLGGLAGGKKPLFSLFGKKVKG
jgi:tetratricopeptide (TPR) repeat protein